MHDSGGKLTSSHKRDKILKPIWGTEERQQPHSKLRKKFRVARNSQARLQSFGACTKTEPSTLKKPPTFLLELRQSNRWLLLVQSGDTRSKAEEEPEPVERSPLQQEWISWEKQNSLGMSDLTLAKWQSTDSTGSSLRKRKFRELSKFAFSTIPAKKATNRPKDFGTRLPDLLKSPIIGNRELTEEEESVVEQLSVLLNEDPLLVFAIDPLIIEVAYLVKEFSSERNSSRSKSQQTSHSKLKPLDEEHPQPKLGFKSSGYAGTSLECKDQRIIHKIIPGPKITLQEHSSQLSVSDFIPQELDADFEICKKKIIGNPSLDSKIGSINGGTETESLSFFSDTKSGIGLLEAPQPKRANPAKTVEASAVVSWTLIGKRMSPVFQDVQVNRWPSVSERKGDKKCSTHPPNTTSAGKAKGSAIAEVHPWQNLLKDFGPSFDESSDEDLIQKGIVFMKKQLHSGLRELDRKNPGEGRDMEVVGDILLGPFESAAGHTAAPKPKPPKQQTRPSQRAAPPELEGLRSVLASSVPLEAVNVRALVQVQHCSAAELSSNQPLAAGSVSGSLCDSADEHSRGSSPARHSPQTFSHRPSIDAHASLEHSGEDEFL